jgi:hypothetical protein
MLEFRWAHASALITATPDHSPNQAHKISGHAIAPNLDPWPKLTKSISKHSCTKFKTSNQAHITYHAPNHTGFKLV